MTTVTGIDCDEEGCGNRFIRRDSTAENVRKIAKTFGWTRVPTSKSFTDYGDFCPLHSRPRSLR